MMDVGKIGVEVTSGLSVICATCERYWEGKERSSQDVRCAAPLPCGSPLAGLTFPAYRGPITDFTRWCFVCGQPADLCFAVRGERRMVGVCKDHVGMLRQLKPVSDQPQRAVAIVRPGEILTPDRYFGPTRKTLGQVIAETEALLSRGGD